MVVWTEKNKRHRGGPQKLASKGGAVWCTWVDNTWKRKACAQEKHGANLKKTDIRFRSEMRGSKKNFSKEKSKSFGGSHIKQRYS